MQRRAVLAAALLAATLLPLPASAQVPALCGPLEISPDATEVRSEDGSAVAVRVTVSNLGRLDGTVTVSFSEPGAGWTRTPDRVEFPSAAGEPSPPIVLRFTPPADAAGPTETDVVVSASISCGALGEAQAPPKAVRATFAGAPTGAAGTDGSPTPDASQRQGGAGPDGSGPTLPAASVPRLAITFFGVLAVASAGLLLRGRSRLVMSIPDPRVLVPPGRGSAVPVAVTNRGSRTERVTLAAGEVPPGWGAFVSVPEFSLAPGETRTVPFLIRPPPGATEGRRSRLEFLARTRGPRPQVRNVRVDADVREES